MNSLIWGTHEDQVGRSIAGWYFMKVEKPNYDILSIYCAMGVIDETGTLKGAAIFTNYNHSNMEVHYYGPHTGGIKTWRAVLRFAFKQLKVNRLTTMTNRGNKKLLKLLPRYGFRYETSLKRFYGIDKSQDAIVHVIYSEDIERFLNNGRRQQSPEPTDPRKVIKAQSEANTRALQESQAANQVNQVNTAGTKQWQLLGYDQFGNPQYGVSEQYNPQEQALKNFMTGTQSIGGQMGNTLLNNAQMTGNYDQPFDPTAAVGDAVSGRLGQMTSYLDPYFSKQSSDLDNQLRNQGLVPGDEAYDEQMHQVRDTQNQSIQSLLATFQPQAFQQAYQQHEAPIKEAIGLSQFGQPAPLGFSTTGQYGQNPADATGAYRTYDQQKMAQWQAQQAQNSGFWQGIGGLAGTVLGGPIGGSIGSGIAGMFA